MAQRVGHAVRVAALLGHSNGLLCGLGGEKVVAELVVRSGRQNGGVLDDAGVVVAVVGVVMVMVTVLGVELEAVGVVLLPSFVDHGVVEITMEGVHGADVLLVSDAVEEAEKVGSREIGVEGEHALDVTLRLSERGGGRGQLKVQAATTEDKLRLGGRGGPSGEPVVFQVTIRKEGEDGEKLLTGLEMDDYDDAGCRTSVSSALRFFILKDVMCVLCFVAYYLFCDLSPAS